MSKKIPAGCCPPARYAGANHRPSLCDAPTSSSIDRPIAAPSATVRKTGGAKCRPSAQARSGANTLSHCDIHCVIIGLFGQPAEHSPRITATSSHAHPMAVADGSIIMTDTKLSLHVAGSTSFPCELDPSSQGRTSQLELPPQAVGQRGLKLRHRREAREAVRRTQPGYARSAAPNFLDQQGDH